MLHTIHRVNFVFAYFPFYPSFLNFLEVASVSMKHSGLAHALWGQLSRGQTLALPLAACVTKCKLLNSLSLKFTSSLKWV